MQNKKGLSEVVSYVLLIVIAISLSVIVFTFLKEQIPRQTADCPEGVSIIISDYACDPFNNKINITFQNKGNFNIDGAYIRIANETDGGTIHLLQADPPPNSLTSDGFLYFGSQGSPVPLSPNVNYLQNFTYANHNNITKVQVEPFISDGETQELIICEEKLVNVLIEGCY